MKTGNFTQKQFAKMIFEHGIAMQDYCSDLFYDIKTMMNETNNGTREATFFMFTRPTGTHLTQNESEISTYKNYNENGYKIEFTKEGIIVTEILEHVRK